jgi:type IV secretory pathway VirB4 component
MSFLDSLAPNPYVIIFATAMCAIVLIVAIPEWRRWRAMLTPEGLRRGQNDALSDVLPYERPLAPDVYELDNGSLLAAWDISAPEAGTMDRESILNTAHLLGQGIGAIDPGMALEIFVTREPAGEYAPGLGLDSPAAIMFDELRAKQFTEDERVMETRVSISVTWFPPNETEEQLRARLAAGAASKVRSKAEFLATFQVLADRVQSKFERDYITIKRLGEHDEYGITYTDLGSFIEGCITGTRKKMRRPPLLRRLKHFFSCEASGGMQPAIGDRFVSAIEFEELPGYAEPMMLDALNSRVKVPAMFHVRYIGRPLSEMKKKLNTAKRDFEGAATWNTGGGVDPAAAQAAVQTMVATGKAGNEDTRFGDVSLALVVRARTVPLLRKAEAEVIAVMEDAPNGGFRCKVARLSAADLFLSTLPGNLEYGTHEFPCDSLTVGKMTPIHVPDMGREYAESEALPFATPPTTYGLTPGNNQIRIHGNSGGVWHKVTSGPSESGKSVGETLWAISQRSRLPLLGINTVDSGPSAYQACKLFNGKYYKLGTTNGFGLALFAHVEEPEEALAILRIIEEQMIVPALGTVSPGHHLTLQATMEKVAEMHPMRRSLLAFYDQISDQDGMLRPIIRKYTRHELGNIIDSNVDTFDVCRWNVLDIRDIIGLQPHFLGAIYRAIIHKCFSQVERLKKRMGASGSDLHWWYSFDEAHRLFEDDLFCAAIRDVLKEGRKFNYSVGLTSNSVSDFVKFKYRTDLLEQARTFMFYGDPNAIATNETTLADYRNMAVPDRGVALLPRMPTYSFLLKQPGVLREARLGITKEQLLVLGTSRTAPLVDQAIARYGDSPEKWGPPYLRSRGALWAADRLEQIYGAEDYREDRLTEILGEVAA